MLNPFKKHVLNEQHSTSTLALQSGQFISRIFTDITGQQFRLTFFVSIVNGEAKGHLVSAQPISTSAHLRLAGTCSDSTIFCLPIACPQKEIETAYIPAYTPVVSPFTELFFFTSQPTRAPSHN